MIRKKEKYKSKNCIKILLLCTALLPFSLCFAQSPALYNLSDVYDFKVKTIYYLHQAKNRHVWMGTDQGLFEFDGTGFHKYINNAYQSEYSEIREDREGRIWCVNFAGQVLYTEGDSLKLFRDVSEYTGDGLLECSPAHFPDIYIGTDYGYIVADFYDKNSLEHVQTGAQDNDKYKILSSGDTIYGDWVDRLQPWKNGFVYINSNIPNEQTVTQLQKDSVWPLFSVKDRFLTPPVVFPRNDCLMMLGIKNDNVFTIYTHKKDTTVVKTYTGLPRPNAVALYYDAHTRQYWLGTTDGVLLFDRDLKLQKEIPSFLKENSVSDIIRDHEGNYWTATLYNGIYIIPSLDIVTLNSGNSVLLQDSLIDLEQTDDNTLFLTDHKGNLYRYSIAENKLVFLLNTGKAHRKMTYNPVKKQLYFHGLNKLYDLKSGILMPSNIINIKAGTAIDSSNFLISQSGAAYITDFETSPAKKPMDTTWQQRYPFLSDSFKSPNQLILRRKRSQDNTVCHATGTLYVSYIDGLFCYKNAMEHQVLFNNNSLIVTSLQPAPERGVWVASTEGRLFYIDENKVTPVTRFDAAISHIRQKDSLLLLGTDNGLIKYNLNSKQQEVINTLDGLPSNAITGLAVVKDKVYVATLKGLARVPLSYNYKNTVAPEVTLTQISVNGKARTPESILTLNPKENNLAFSFGTYALRSQKTFSYAYRIAEIDSAWTSTPINTVGFTALSPGRYTFQLKAVNEDGVASTEVKEIRFVIDKPYYQKWWFYLIITIGVGVLVASGFSYRIRNLKKQNALQQEQNILQQRQKSLEKKLAESTITALKAQMNPHFTFNTMNAVQSLILKGNRDEAYNYLAKFSTLLRESLNISEKNFIYFDKELEMITTYLELEKLRLRSNFEYEIKGTEDIEDIKIPAMIIQPFVENAIKHGLSHKEGSKKLTIHFQQNGTLQCSITDNGIGRKASEAIKENSKRKHTSFSTGAMEKRFALLREYYNIDLGFSYTDLEENNSPAGTRVILKIPYLADDE